MARAGLRGTKKIDTITIKGDFTTEKIDLRYHTEDGTFHASIGTVNFQEDSLPDLKQKLADHLKKQEVLTWDKYILIDYSPVELATVLGGTRGQYYGRDKTPTPNNVGGLTLEYQVFEVSNPFTMQIGDNKRPVRRWREYRRNKIYGEWVRVGGTGNEEQHTEDHHKYTFSRLIPYSDERIATLDRIQAAIADLDRRMGLMFGKGATGTAIAQVLDRLDTTKLLGSGAF